jgi:hypothetical protein
MRPRARSRRPVRRQRATWWAAGAAGAILITFGVLYATRPAPTLPGNAQDAVFPFPCLPTEGDAQHIHPYLRIVINGQPVTVPAFIGIRALPGGGACLEPVHTHDASGIVHIESPSPTQTYTLVDFFAIWRATYQTVDIQGTRYPVDYTLAELLGHRADAQHAIRLLVDGTRSLAGPGLALNTFPASDRTRRETQNTGSGELVWQKQTTNMDHRE